MMLGGAAVAATIAYFTLYAHKKPIATAIDVAKVTSGTASPENTHHRRKNFFDNFSEFWFLSYFLSPFSSLYASFFSKLSPNYTLPVMV
ncbi:hypothetical protein L6452_03050 [Arctium lappa]|uniref:Uncharacterized protein n=1 Tax=Arctium lappa TaxID=4217 RepID=A0ACB9FKL2_ARCLA|nr:hypothetical protein L6452_03050 [Arctium lappa]